MPIAVTLWTTRWTNTEGIPPTSAQILSTTIEKTINSMQLSALKPKQLEAVSSFVAGNNTFVSLPTGYGKSIIYAILPLVFDYIRG